MFAKTNLESELGQIFWYFSWELDMKGGKMELS